LYSYTRSSKFNPTSAGTGIAVPSIETFLSPPPLHRWNPGCYCPAVSQKCNTQPAEVNMQFWWQSTHSHHTATVTFPLQSSDHLKECD